MHLFIKLSCAVILIIHRASALLAEGDECSLADDETGICKDMFNCDDVIIPGVSPDSLMCNLTLDIPLVCCSKTNKASITTRVSKPQVFKHKHSCGYPYGLAITWITTPDGAKHRFYHLNRTAERYAAEGFKIKVNEMFDDAIKNFTYSNATFSDTVGFVSLQAVAPVGGRPADKTRAYYMALLGKRVRNSITWLCDGVLINSQWVLSAAHCFIDLEYRPDVVRLGEYDWKAPPESLYDNYPIDYEMEEVVIHPLFKLPSRYDDLVLIKIHKPIPQRQHSMNPICLPWGEEASRNLVGQNVTLTGWGTTSYNPISATKTNILTQVDLEVYNVSICDEAYSKLSNFRDKYKYGMTEDTVLCAGKLEGGKDACKGDSGGPLAYEIENGYIYLAGIVSGGYGCGVKGYPGLYSPIQNQLNLKWIKDVAFT